MAWAFVQAVKTANNGAPPNSVTLTGTTAGNMIVVCVCTDHATPSTAPSDGTNTYVQAGTTGVDSANSQEASVWYAKNIAGGNVTISPKPATATANSTVAMEFSGLDHSAPLDTTATPTAGATLGATPTSNSLSAAGANELMILAVNDTSANNATFTASFGTLNTNANEAGVTGTGATAVAYGNTVSGSQTAAMNNTQTTDKGVILLAAFILAGGATPRTPVVIDFAVTRASSY